MPKPRSKLRSFSSGRIWPKITLAVPMLRPTLLSELGVATVLAGGVLAYRAHLKNRPALQTTAGLLLIAGFACLGVAISLIGLPLQ